MKILFKPDTTKSDAQNRRALANRLCRILERDRYLREDLAALLDIDPNTLSSERPDNSYDLDLYTEL